MYNEKRPTDAKPLVQFCLRFSPHILTATIDKCTFKCFGFVGFFWIGVHQVGGTMSYIFRYWFYSVENWFGFGFSTIFFSTYQKHKLPLKRIDKLEKRMNKLGFRSNCIHIWQLAHFTAHDRRKTLSFFFLQFILQYISCGTQFNWSSLLFGLVTTPCLRCNCVVALFKLNVVWFSILTTKKWEKNKIMEKNSKFCVVMQ